MSSRRGSALLVVLGMVAFMVISAVAFSAYMRYSRLPSSYLRRSSSSRLLVKAALAKAIDQIDRDIGENVHPNVGMRPPRGVSANNVGNTGVGRNVWAHRVYLGTNNVNNLASPDSTVSTLTLEGLAHIPPPLVNDVRYYSRRSLAARWRPLGFDAGRYAFCAIDVSDFFDVNALAANAGRSSSASGRIALAHLFENAAHTAYEANPSDWDGSRFMQNFRSESPVAAALKGLGAAADTIVPFVSVADFNLALHDKAPGLFTSPFCQYVEQDKKSFYGGLDGSSAEGARIRGMTFVTDAYYPSAGGTGADDDYDLADPQHQPWTGDQLSRDPGTVSFGETRTALTPAGQRICNRISGLGMAELYDYLDENNVPVSLAIPSVERTPMIAGFEADLPGASVKINATTVPNNNPTDDGFPNVVAGTAAAAAGATRTIRYQKVYKLDGQAFSAAAMGKIKTVLAYPFRRGSDVDSPDTFRLDGHIAFYLTTGNGSFRSQNPSSLLQVTADGGKLGPNVQLPDNAAVFHVQLPQTGITLPSPNNNDENAVGITPSDLAPGPEGAQQIYDAAEQNAMLIVTYDEQQQAQQNLATGTWFWNRGTPTISNVECNMRPINATGVVDPDFAPATLRTWIEQGSRSVTVRAAVWLRVTNGDGKTVDLVPACLEDDEKFLGVSGASTGPADSDDLGSAYPTMFLTGGTFDFSLSPTAGFDNFNPVQLNFETKSGKKGAMCPDPRWNWAPEHWYAASAVSASDWVTAAHKFQSDEQGCDHDIFMASSDAGYLQSIWELAFLPRSTTYNDQNENHGYDGLSLGQLETPMDGRTEWGDDDTTVRNRRLMWRTYRPYDRAGLQRDRFFDGNQPWFVSEGGGCKVNPYSDNLDVLMAAFANTPFDWWAASTNWQAEAAIQKETRLDAKQFNQKYALNAMNSNARFAWTDLQQVALKFLEKIHGGEAAQQAAFGRPGLAYESGGESGLRFKTETDVDIWKDKWDELDWDGENSDLCGVTLSSSDQLFDVDRKFLYGYWRDCFAPRQQLFLIFARAEPMMMGGGGSTPPQLGARAVALVWRDPTTTGDNSKPHRTRVLFYRQLD